jgi:hypothetical protein
MDFKRLTDSEWTRLLGDIKAGRFSGQQLAHNIAVLAKPADHGRIDRAKYIVAQYVDDPDDWVRHEVLWFFLWGHLREFRSAIADRLRDDRNADNRAYAATCLGRLCKDSQDAAICERLAKSILAPDEDPTVRTSAYAALLLVVRGDEAVPMARKFEFDELGLDDIDVDWVVSPTSVS